MTLESAAVSSAPVEQDVLQDRPRLSGRTRSTLNEQEQIDQYWEYLLGLKGAKFEERTRGVFTLCIKEPGPGDIINYDALRRDDLARDANPQAKVDICRAEARCLYLTIFNLADAKRLVWKHQLPRLV